MYNAKQGNIPIDAAQHEPFVENRFIIVIDDSITVRALAHMHLVREGMDVLAFSDGVQALQWLAASDEHLPAVILLDIDLPKLDGYKVARLFRERVQHCHPIIIMWSSRDGTADRLKGKLAGVDSYLTKPCHIQVLIAAVKAALQRFQREHREKESQ